MALAVTESERLLIMKNYIWDFDGMLFDSYPHITSAFIKALSESGKTADYDEAKALLEITYATAYEHYGGTEEEKEAKIQTVKAIYDDLNIGEEAKAEITRLHSRAMEHAAGLGLKPEAYALLENYAKKLIGRTK